ncbi:MAG: ABC transporter ATP-binding protein, partial [Chloroflexota bacterium]
MAAELNTMDLQQTLAKRRLVGLWRLARGYRLLLLIATSGVGVASLARAGTYLLLGYFVDAVLVRDDLRRALPWVAGGFIVLALFQGGLTYLSGRLAARSAEGIAKRLREFMYDHLQRLPFAYHDQARTGELVQRSTSDVDAVRRFFSDQAINAGRIFLMFLVNLAVLISLDVQLALLSVIVVPITVTMSYLFFRRISQAYEDYQEQEAVLSATLQENLAGVRVVKAFARQEFERNKFDTENWEKFRRGRRLLIMHSLHWPISDILSGLQTLFGFTIG